VAPEIDRAPAVKLDPQAEPAAVCSTWWAQPIGNRAISRPGPQVLEGVDASPAKTPAQRQLFAVSHSVPPASAFTSTTSTAHPRLLAAPGRPAKAWR